MARCSLDLGKKSTGKPSARLLTSNRIHVLRLGLVSYAARGVLLVRAKLLSYAPRLRRSPLSKGAFVVCWVFHISRPPHQSRRHGIFFLGEKKTQTKKFFRDFSLIEIGYDWRILKHEPIGNEGIDLLVSLVVV